MWYDLLAVSGLFFWIAVLLVFLLVALPLRDDNVSASLTLLGLGGVAFVLFSDLVFKLSWFWLAMLVPLYVLTGVGWALYKWRSFVLEKKAGEIKAYDAYMQRPLAAGEKRKTFVEFSTRPTAAANKERITGWMILWPWSMSWVVLRFPHRFFSWLYERISTVFERWSAKLWAD